MQDLFIRNNKVTTNYNSLLDDVVGYKTVRLQKHNRLYDVACPVIKRITTKELFKRLFLAVIGSALVYTFLVLVIGMIPMYR